MGICVSANKDTKGKTPAAPSLPPEEEPQINLKEEIELKEQLGKGALCKVHKGWWKTQQIFVAVKTFHCPDLTPVELKDFRRELNLTKKLFHPNVVKMLAGCTVPPSVYLIVEFVELGSLGDILHKQKKPLSWSLKLRILSDTAKGMAYLHLNKVVHRDLKPDNLLVASMDPNADVCLKIADLGISKFKEDASSMTIGRGTTQWMAPEVLDQEHRNYSFPVDVYSFGIIMWELVAHQLPFIGLSFFRIPVEVARGLRPPIPPAECVPTGYTQIMTHAWATDPRERPTFDDVFARLLAVSQNFVMQPRDLLPFDPPPLVGASTKAAAPKENTNNADAITVPPAAPPSPPQAPQEGASPSPPHPEPSSLLSVATQDRNIVMHRFVPAAALSSSSPVLSAPSSTTTTTTTIPQPHPNPPPPSLLVQSPTVASTPASSRPPPLLMSSVPIAQPANHISPLRSSGIAAASEKRRGSRKAAFERLEGSNSSISSTNVEVLGVITSSESKAKQNGMYNGAI